VVNKVLEFFSSLASRNSSVLVMASGLTGVYVALLTPLRSAFGFKSLETSAHSGAIIYENFSASNLLGVVGTGL
jgi:hypothetical protein